MDEPLESLTRLAEDLRRLDGGQLRALARRYRAWRDVLPAAIDDSMARLSRGRARVLRVGPVVTEAVLSSPGVGELEDDDLEQALIAAWLYALETIGDGDRAVGRLLAAPFSEALGPRLREALSPAS